MNVFELVGTFAVKGLKETGSDIDSATAKAKKGFEEMGEEAEKSSKRTKDGFEESSQAANPLIDGIKRIGGAVVAYMSVSAIKDFAGACVDAAASVSAENSAFEQVMGAYAEQANAKLQGVSDATGITTTRMTGQMTKMTAKFQGLGFGVEDATSLAADGLTIAADAAAMWDVSMDDSTSALNSFINGSYEGGEAIGLFANDSRMAQYAVQQGLVDSTSAWANLDEATKQATRLDYAKNMMEQSGATGQAAKEADQYASVQANLTEKWRQFQAKIGDPILQNIVIPAMDALSGIVDSVSAGFEDLCTWVSENQETLQVVGGIAIGAAVGFAALALALNIGSIASAAVTAFNTVKTAVMGLNFALAANPIGIVIALVAGLVAAFIYFWNTSEAFRNFWIGLWDAICAKAGEVWGWLDTNLIQPVQAGFQAFCDFLNLLFTDPFAVLRMAGEGILGWMNSMFPGFGDTVGGVITGMQVFFSDPFGTLRAAGQGILDWMNSTFPGLGDLVGSVINGLKAVFEDPFGTLRDAVNNIINWWSEHFKLPEIQWPAIPLPHPVVNPAGWQIGDLLKGSVPSIGLEWYAKAMDNGMIMNQPTVFGYNPTSGSMMAGGEAGSETVVGTGSLMSMISRAANSERSEQLLEAILAALQAFMAKYDPNLRIVADTGAAIAWLAPPLAREFEDRKIRRER
ncbi:MAG: hypothetical protein RR178_05240 [Gordonibacter sp.]